MTKLPIIEGNVVLGPDGRPLPNGNDLLRAAFVRAGVAYTKKTRDHLRVMVNRDADEEAFFALHARMPIAAQAHLENMAERFWALFNLAMTMIDHFPYASPYAHIEIAQDLARDLLDILQWDHPNVPDPELDWPTLHYEDVHATVVRALDLHKRGIR